MFTGSNLSKVCKAWNVDLILKINVEIVSFSYVTDLLWHEYTKP